MVIFDKKADLGHTLAEIRAQKKSIGFVPTMGALHPGHLSLVERAKKENDVVVVSIFVNPAQFNNQDDLKNYPRTLDPDKELLQKVKTDILFFPSVDEVYPPGEVETEVFDFGSLEKVMEGKFRPGHFKGVAKVVAKLFKIVNPQAAYFGEKDFQQLTIIRELAKQMKSAIQITGCPTVRESDGLAMSSRNMLLSETERKEASMISKALFFIRDNRKQYTLKEIKQKATEMIEHPGLMKVEYLEIAEEETLQPVTGLNLSEPLRCFTAVKLGKVRLIDNISLKS